MLISERSYHKDTACRMRYFPDIHKGNPCERRAGTEVRNRSVGRILYAGKSRRAIIPLGRPLLACSGHLPACSGGPPCRHQACTCLFGVAPDRGCRVSPCHGTRETPVRYGDGRTCVRPSAHPRDRLVSVALVLGLPEWGRRTAVSRYRVLWSPDLPRRPKTPRLPDLPRARIVRGIGRQGRPVRPFA